jgi:hypothetical protein
LFVSQVSFAKGEVLCKYRQLLATWSMLASFLEEPSCFFFSCFSLFSFSVFLVVRRVVLYCSWFFFFSFPA